MTNFYFHEFLKSDFEKSKIYFGGIEMFIYRCSEKSFQNRHTPNPSPEGNKPLKLHVFIPIWRGIRGVLVSFFCEMIYLKNYSCPEKFCAKPDRFLPRIKLFWKSINIIIKLSKNPLIPSIRCTIDFQKNQSHQT
jgi:hypothetical protein